MNPYVKDHALSKSTKDLQSSNLRLELYGPQSTRPHIHNKLGEVVCVSGHCMGLAIYTRTTARCIYHNFKVDYLQRPDGLFKETP